MLEVLNQDRLPFFSIVAFTPSIGKNWKFVNWCSGYRKGVPSYRILVLNDGILARLPLSWFPRLLEFLSTMFTTLMAHLAFLFNFVLDSGNILMSHIFRPTALIQFLFSWSFCICLAFFLLNYLACMASWFRFDIFIIFWQWLRIFCADEKMSGIWVTLCGLPVCTSSLTSWPLAIRNFGIRSTFQSLRYFRIIGEVVEHPQVPLMWG